VYWQSVVGSVSVVGLVVSFTHRAFGFRSSFSPMGGMGERQNMMYKFRGNRDANQNYGGNRMNRPVDYTDGPDTNDYTGSSTEETN
jgi:hypothetical protein